MGGTRFDSTQPDASRKVISKSLKLFFLSEVYKREEQADRKGGVERGGRSSSHAQLLGQPLWLTLCRCLCNCEGFGSRREERSLRRMRRGLEANGIDAGCQMTVVS